MTKNLTMAIDRDLLKKARKIAVDKDTTVTGLIRKYLENLVEQQEKTQTGVISELSELFDRSGAVVGKKTWTREDLHGR